MTRALLLSASLVLLSSCNIFDFMDSPSGNAQTLSAARAALDRRDFEEARKLYESLTDNADIQKSEIAFTILTENNVGMAAFASALGTGEGLNFGKALTSIANTIGHGRGVPARVNLLTAFKQAPGITNDALRGMVRVFTAAALLAETLAEAAADPTHFAATDLAVDPTACVATVNTDTTTCGTAGTVGGSPAGSGVCVGPTEALKSGTADIDLETLTETTVAEAANAPTIALIKGAIDEINQGLSELGAGGNLSGSIGDFTDAFANVGLTPYSNDAPCYRAYFIKQGLGTY